MGTNVSEWLSHVFSGYLESTSQDALEESKEQIKKLLQTIIFTIHISKSKLERPITTTNWVSYIEEAIKAVSTKDNIVFYSKNQLPIFNSEAPIFEKVVILGGFGSGKSFLLQEKAEILCCNKDYVGRILYVPSSGLREDSLLYQSLKARWKGKGILIPCFPKVSVKIYYLLELLGIVRPPIY